MKVRLESCNPDGTGGKPLWVGIMLDDGRLRHIQLPSTSDGKGWRLAPYREMSAAFIERMFAVNNRKFTNPDPNPLFEGVGTQEGSNAVGFMPPVKLGGVPVPPDTPINCRQDYNAQFDLGCNEPPDATATPRPPYVTATPMPSHSQKSTFLPYLFNTNSTPIPTATPFPDNTPSPTPVPEGTPVPQGLIIREKDGGFVLQTMDGSPPPNQQELCGAIFIISEQGPVVLIPDNPSACLDILPDGSFPPGFEQFSPIVINVAAIVSSENMPFTPLVGMGANGEEEPVPVQREQADGAYKQQEDVSAFMYEGVIKPPYDSLSNTYVYSVQEGDRIVDSCVIPPDTSKRAAAHTEVYVGQIDSQTGLVMSQEVIKLDLSTLQSVDIVYGNNDAYTQNCWNARIQEEPESKDPSCLSTKIDGQPPAQLNGGADNRFDENGIPYVCDDTNNGNRLKIDSIPRQ